MFYLTKIAATSPSSVTGMTKHLLNATLEITQNIEALSLVQGNSLEIEWYILAQDVLEGNIEYSEAIHTLMEPWYETANYGDPNFDNIEHALKVSFEDQFDTLINKIDAGTALAPLAIVRPDIEAGVAMGLGIIPGMLMSQDQVNAFIAGRKIDGSLIQGKYYAKERTNKDGSKQHPIGSFDFCATAPKKFSTAWAFASPEERAKLLALHTQAAREGAAYIADEIGVARFGKDRSVREQGAVAWLEFTHHTARRVQLIADDPTVVEIKDAGHPGDPSVHTHFVFSNAVFTPSGKVGTMDTNGIGGFIKEAGQFYQARLGTLLREAGYDVGVDRHNFIELRSVPDQVADLFSKRSTYGEELARRFTERAGEDWDELDPRQQAARVTAAVNNMRQVMHAGPDDLADFDHWKQQVHAVRWKIPETFELQGPPLGYLSVAERQDMAYEIAIKYLEKKFEHKAVLSHYDLRYAALIGLSHTGVRERDETTERIADVDAVTKLMRTKGVLQYGELTELMYGYEGDRSVSVTTKLHKDQEAELIELFKKAHADKSGAINSIRMNYHLNQAAKGGLDFTDAHGKAQRAATFRVGTNSRFELIVAAAGAGKTTAMGPLVAAKHAAGGEVHAASLAWQQADDLVKAGVPKENVHAFSVLLHRIEQGSVTLNKKSTVIIDEYGLLGSRQLLQLMRYQNKYGFSVVALADPKQLSGIEAGNGIDLATRAIGENQIPTIDTTQRQKGREAHISGLLREGNAELAIALKRQDGTAIMADGGRAGTIAEVVRIFMSANQEIAVSTPTNQDAHQISMAIRHARQAAGQIEPDTHPVIKATSGTENYVMQLAKGDRVRLFKSIGATFMWTEPNGQVKMSGGNIGRNGSVLTVEAVRPAGLMLRTVHGKVGSVTWQQLKYANGRTLLAYGDAKTFHSSQGSTSQEQIIALLDGSQSINGYAGYSAATRHKDRSWLVTNGLKEEISVKESRPINAPGNVTDDEKWAHVVRRLAWQPEKDSATAMVERVTELKQGAVDLKYKLHAEPDPRVRAKVQAAAPEVVQLRKIDIIMNHAKTAAVAVQRTIFRDHDNSAGI